MDDGVDGSIGGGEQQPTLDPSMVEPSYDQSPSRARNSRFAVVGVFAFVVIAIVVIMLIHVS